MHSLVFYLGLWNPAGASRKKFNTREEREQYRKQATDNGYICWEEGDLKPLNFDAPDPSPPSHHGDPR